MVRCDDKDDKDDKDRVTPYLCVSTTEPAPSAWQDDLVMTIKAKIQVEIPDTSDLGETERKSSPRFTHPKLMEFSTVTKPQR